MLIKEINFLMKKHLMKKFFIYIQETMENWDEDKLKLVVKANENKYKS